MDTLSADLSRLRLSTTTKFSKSFDDVPRSKFGLSAGHSELWHHSSSDMSTGIRKSVPNQSNRIPRHEPTESVL